MKVKIFGTILFFILFCRTEAQDTLKIPFNYNNMSFNEFVSATENLLKIKFYYKEEWVGGLKMRDYKGSNRLTDILDELFRGNAIYYSFDKSGNIVLTKDYAIMIPEKPVENATGFTAPADYSGSPENLKSVNTFVDIGNPAERNKEGNVTISGYVTNSDTKEPVSGVTIFIKKLAVGVITNEFGFYSLTLQRGIHILQFSFIGMREKTVNLNLYGSGELNVGMRSVLVPLKEAVVSAQKNITLQRFEVGAEKINITSFRLLPTSMGESDIIKSILLIPGVQSVGEGSAGFNVRGGTADQNLILLYGAPIYNSSHFFGFFSAVNPDLIRDVTLYKGGIPCRYGERISSVLDIGTIEGNKKEFQGNAGISPITTHVMIQGPLVKDTLTYVLGARTTYSNWIFSLINNPALRNSRASFYDINGKVTYDLNKNNKIETSYYLSHDSFRFNSDSVYQYNNNILALKWRHFFNSRFFSSVSLNSSSYKYDISSEVLKPEAFDLSHKVNSKGFKADINWFAGRNEFNFGADLNHYSIIPGSYKPAGDSSLVVPHVIQEERAWEGAIYFEDKITLSSFLSVNAGVRLSSYFTTGPGIVMVYKDGLPKSQATIIDTLRFNSGKISSRYSGPEPRISFNFRLSDRNSIKINYNRTRQYLHLLSNSASISPTDSWKLSDYYLKPQIGDQIALGIYQMLFKSGFESSAEIYYKGIRNMVDFKGGTNLIMNDNIIQDMVNVKGKAYGIELIFRKIEGRLRYSIGYTYSRTFIRSISALNEEIINNGKWFPANFDKPNDLVITFNYTFSRRLSFSSNYTWSTGRPVTFPVSTYEIYNNILIDYSDRNQYRIPDYSRLDVSLTLNGNLRSHKLAHPMWTFSVYNLFGRPNVYSTYFRRVGDVYKGYELSVFGVAVPSVTFSFDF
jgi:hypothetical protein